MIADTHLLTRARIPLVFTSTIRALRALVSKPSVSRTTDEDIKRRCVAHVSRLMALFILKSKRRDGTENYLNSRLSASRYGFKINILQSKTFR